MLRRDLKGEHQVAAGRDLAAFGCWETIRVAVWPKCGEIDIMENVGKRAGIITFAARASPRRTGLTATIRYQPGRLSNDFSLTAVGVGA